MFRISVVALVAGVAMAADANEPATGSKTIVPENKSRTVKRAEAGVDCGKLVEHLYVLQKAEITKNVPEAHRADALTEFERSFKSESPKLVKECYDDPGVTRRSAQCLLGAKAMAEAIACMESGAPNE